MKLGGERDGLSRDVRPLSVVMTVYNAQPFLNPAVESILGQSFDDFDFLIRDDGSTDGSGDALEEWARRDPRIRLYRGSRQLGPVGSSNWISRKASTPLIARMDADDISHPDRLRRQVAVLDAHPEADLVGCLFESIDGDGRIVRCRDRWRLLRRSLSAPFGHGSIMYRRSALERVGGYRPAAEYWEDQDFYLRIAAGGAIMVLPESLYRQRYAVTSTRLVSQRERVERCIDLGQRCRAALLQGNDYEPMLRRGPDDKPRRVQPKAMIAVASLDLWAKRRPRILGRLLRAAEIRPNLASAAALTWGLWAWCSPATLRQAGSLATYLRDRRAARRVRDGQVYRWPTVPLPAQAAAAAAPADQAERAAGSSSRLRTAP